MAQIFQANTGYRDPSKVMTIKALEARMKAAQEAASSATQLQQPISDPWQGASHLAGVLGSGFQQARAENEAASARGQLSKLMAGITDYSHVDPGTLSQIGALDPEQQKFLTERMLEIQKREDEQQFQHGESELTRGAAATEAEKTRTQQTTLQDDAQQAQADAARLEAENAVKTATTLSERQAAEKRLEEVAASTEKARQEGAAVAETKRQEQTLPTTDVGKIDADYNKGIYGAVGSPEAIKQRDDAIAAENAKGQIKPADRFTPGQAEADKVAAKEIQDWKTVGGANAAKSVQEVKHAIDLLEQNKGGTLGISGRVIGSLPEVGQKWFNQPGVIARDSIKNTVQLTLRQVLGSQYTEKEGSDLMNRAFDPMLGEEENIRRAKLIMEQISTIAANKQSMTDYWDKDNRGTVTGWTGLPININVLDMFKDADGSGTAADSGSPAPPKRVTVTRRNP